MFFTLMCIKISVLFLCDKEKKPATYMCRVYKEEYAMLQKYIS